MTLYGIALENIRIPDGADARYYFDGITLLYDTLEEARAAVRTWKGGALWTDADGTEQAEAASADAYIVSVPEELADAWTASRTYAGITDDRIEDVEAYCLGTRRTLSVEPTIAPKAL